MGLQAPGTENQVTGVYICKCGLKQDTHKYLTNAELKVSDINLSQIMSTANFMRMPKINNKNLRLLTK